MTLRNTLTAVVLIMFLTMITACTTPSNYNAESTTNSNVQGVVTPQSAPTAKAETIPNYKSVPLSLTEDNYYDRKINIQTIKTDAVTAKDIKICEAISYDYSRASCVEAVAVATKNSALCNELLNILEKRMNFEPESALFSDQCEGLVANAIAMESKLAQTKKDVEGTDKASLLIESCELNRVARDSCYVDKAEATGDKKYCSMIGESDIANCEKYIEYRLLLDQIKKTGTRDDCSKIDSAFYFRGNINYWCTAFFDKQG